MRFLARNRARALMSGAVTLALVLVVFSVGRIEAQPQNRFAAMGPRALVGEWPRASRPDRERIADAIAEGGEPSLAVLRDVTATGSRDEKVFACSMIAELRDKDGVPAVLSATTDKDVEVRRRAATALRILGDIRARPRMRALLQSAEDLGVQKSALATLGKIGARSDRARVRPFLAHADPEVRVVAAIALAMLGDMGGRDVLLTAIASNNPGAQKQATFGLGYLDDPASRAHLQAILDDPGGHWKSYAAIAIAARDMQSTSAAEKVAILAPIARGRSRIANRWALEQLTDIATPEARAVIGTLADGTRPVAASARRRLTIAGER